MNKKAENTQVPPRSQIIYALIFGGLMAFGPFTIDLYLPAFPSVVIDLHTTEVLVQLTLTATTIGLGIGQLFFGPLSDAFGRRRPLIIATTLHIIASVAIMFAPTIEWVMFGRVIQGVGAAGSGVIAMAMVRDLFAGQPLVRMLAKMALITSLAPILAPFIGAQLLFVMDWRGLFGVLAAFGLLMTLVSARFVGETLLPEQRLGRGLRAIAARYRILLSDRVFVGVMIVGGMIFSTMFIYLSWSPFIYQNDFGLSAQQYGLAFGAAAIALAICAQISGLLMRRYSPTNIIAGWVGVMLVSALSLYVANTHDAPFLVLMGFILIAVASIGGASPAIQVTAMSRHGKQAGTAASLLGVFNFGVGGAIASIVGAFGISITSMAAGIIVVSTIAILSLIFIVQPRTVGVTT